MNNWHRKIWTLPKMDDSNFYRGDGAANQFWLEPWAYVGSDVTVPASEGPIEITKSTTYTQNALCFRVGFLEGAMTEAWRDLVLFAKGTKPFVIEAPTNETERIENVLEVPLGPGPEVLEVKLRAFLTTDPSPVLYLHVEYDGGGGGWVHTT